MGFFDDIKKAMQPIGVLTEQDFYDVKDVLGEDVGERFWALLLRIGDLLYNSKYKWQINNSFQWLQECRWRYELGSVGNDSDDKQGPYILLGFGIRNRFVIVMNMDRWDKGKCYTVYEVVSTAYTFDSNLEALLYGAYRYREGYLGDLQVIRLVNSCLSRIRY